MFNNFPILPFDDFAAEAYGRKTPSPLKQSSPWIRLTGTYVKSVEAREEMTSRYYAAIYFHVVFNSPRGDLCPRVMTNEGFEGVLWTIAVGLSY